MPWLYLIRARGPAGALVVASALALLVAGCNQEAKTEPPQPRPVRTVTVEKGKVGDSVQLTGDIRAENEVNLAFRIGGRIIERKGEVGDKVEPDQVLAKLDPQDELNGLRSAQAALAAAEAQVAEAQNNFDRQNHLMERGFTTRAIFDSAKQGLQTAQARVDDATAQLDIAQDRVGFTELKANVEGTITARLAESGQVVQAGQPIFTVARQDGRDAVFDVPAQVLRAAPTDATITVALANDPSVTAKARVRTVAPQADPVTRTFQVRLSLIDHPEAMRLGATVTGRLQLEGGQGITIPGDRADFDRPPAGGVDRRSGEPHGEIAQCRGPAVRSCDGGDLGGARARRRGGDGGRPGAASGPEGAAPRSDFVSALNLSDWALKHRSFIVFIMIAVTLAGVASFFSLGRAEDPPFTFRTMIVQAGWPGASMDDTLQQVTERLERKLQETKGLDFLRSYTIPGRTTIFVNLKGSTKASEVPDIWYQVRKNIGDIRGTLPAGVVGPGFNDDFGDTFGLIYGFTADGFTQRELRDYVEDIRSRLLQVPDVSKIELLGAQDERIYVEFSTKELAGLGVDRAALIAALRAQNAVSPAGALETGDEKISLRVSGAFGSEQDLLNVNFLSNGRLIRLRDIATVRRAYSDPPQPMFRVNGKPAIGLAIAMRDGGDILALGRNVKKAIDESIANLPLGIDASLVSDQPVVVQTAIGEFMESLWQAIAIIMAVSIISLGLRPGSVVALTIPLTIAIVFPIMQAMHIDLQRISLGALIISLSLLVDSAMTTIDVMTTRLAQGDSKEDAASFAYKTLAMPMLTGTFVTIAGFVPIGFARSAAGEYTFSIFAVVTIALIVSWFVAVLFAPLLGVWLLKKRRMPPRPSPTSSCAHSARSSSARCGCAGSPSRWRSPVSPPRFWRCPTCPASSSPLPTAPSWWST